MNRRHFWQSLRVWLWLLLAGMALGAAGCATTSDNENSSERPWNAPQDWENGLPPGMYQRPY